MDFKSKKIDMNINLTTDAGEVVELIFDKPVTAALAVEMGKKFKTYEKECEEKNANAKTDDESVPLVEIQANEMSMFYPKYSAKWFAENTDPGTLQEMIVHLSESMAGLKKSGGSKS